MEETPITELLENVKKGEQTAYEELLPIVYEELRTIAKSYMRKERANHTLQPTALVHEAYLKLFRNEGIEWENRSHFFGIAARLMRQILIDHARNKSRQKRGGENQTQIAFNDAVNYGNESGLDVLEIDDALKKLEKLDERQAKIVEMKFFSGLRIKEIAEVLEISNSTVKREWTTAKMFLAKELR